MPIPTELVGSPMKLQRQLPGTQMASEELGV
ncbi:MAG: hypothetical protein QOD24_3385 [Solirubrobacteraceae bacterium]|nr:hypothetical protein [Solirubrobacteraceae bacterium]